MRLQIILTITKNESCTATDQEILEYLAPFLEKDLDQEYSSGRYGYLQLHDAIITIKESQCATSS